MNGVIESLIILLAVLIPVAAGMVAAWHALLYKRDSRAAFGWIGVCLLFPLVGALLYYLVGVNRIETKARQHGKGKVKRRFIDFERGAELRVATETIDTGEAYRGLLRAASMVTGQTLEAGNAVTPLYSGEGAFAPMLVAIDEAAEYILLTTYIFETNRIGRQFIEALGSAVKRGVNVSVMIDGMGEKYSFPRAARLLKTTGANVCRFNPPRLLPPTLTVNLRNHRKIMVVDGHTAFTGGINIGDRHLVQDPGVKRPVIDLHFAVRGPIVSQLQSAFIDTWKRASGGSVPSLLDGLGLVNHVVPERAGDSRCRVICDGPDENLDRLSLVLKAAVFSAHRSVKIMTPYFLPDRAFIGCLQSAALCGVQVEIILPVKNNLPYVHWATRNMLWELLYYGIEIYYQPPPFAHSKLFLVDDSYALVGSANIDPRSLRLNYELGLEIHDRATTSELDKHFRQVKESSESVTLAEVDSRSLAQRTRDAICWLFSPYL